MQRKHTIGIPAALILSLLVLSACASKQEPAPVVAPPAVETVTEKTAAPTPEPVATAATTTEQPQADTQTAPPKASKKIKKAKKPAARTEPAKVEPAPAPVAPPVMETKPAVVAAPEPVPVVVAPPPKEEPGFLEQYWMWLLGLLVVIAGVFLWSKRNQQ